MPQVILDNEKHRNLKYSFANYDNIKDKAIIPLVGTEFAQAAVDCPIVFLKNESGVFESVAVYGVVPEENLWVKENEWHGLYLPTIVQTLPFQISAYTDEDEEQFYLSIDDDNACFSEDQGEPLFDENGNDTELLKSIKKQIVNYYQDQQRTAIFNKTLDDLDLLIPKKLKVNFEDKAYELDSLYIIDEVKFNDLSDEQMMDLLKNNYLHSIYAHFISLHQVIRLAKTSKESESDSQQES